MRATVSYLNASNLSPFSHAHEPPPGVPWESGSYDAWEVEIADARLATTPPDIDREGFVLVDAPSAVTDFMCPEQVERIYLHEASRLALRITGGAQAFVFDHLIRKREAGRPALTFGKRGLDGLAAANGRIHNDYSERSGRRRLDMVIPDAQLRARLTRFCIVNIWRAINGPVLDTPLAVCDARTVLPSDLVVSEVRYPRRTGEIYGLLHNPSHRWSYFSRMDRHEALVFKQFDTLTEGVSRFVPHAAFDLPHIPPDAPLRESIEVRCLVIHQAEGFAP